MRSSVLTLTLALFALFALFGCDAADPPPTSAQGGQFRLEVRDGAETTLIDLSGSEESEAQATLLRRGPDGAIPTLGLTVAVGNEDEGTRRHARVTLLLPLPSDQIVPGVYEVDQAEGVEGRIEYVRRDADGQVGYRYDVAQAHVRVDEADGQVITGRFVITGRDGAREATALGTFRTR